MTSCNSTSNYEVEMKIERCTNTIYSCALMFQHALDELSVRNSM